MEETKAFFEPFFEYVTEQFVVLYVSAYMAELIFDFLRTGCQPSLVTLGPLMNERAISVRELNSFHHVGFVSVQGEVNVQFLGFLHEGF